MLGLNFGIGLQNPFTFRGCERIFVVGRSLADNRCFPR